jgi:hypothetical protein
MGRVVHVGKTIYGITTAVHKVSFHAQSKHDDTLLVLSSDSHLRVFELSLSPHQPEQDIPLFHPPKRGYTPSFNVPVPISFNFPPASSDPWLKWTIFLLTLDGDIYLLCPIMPTKCLLSRADISRLKAVISHRSQFGASTHFDSETTLNQTRWISDILGQVSMGEFLGVVNSPAFTGVDTSDIVTFKRPNKVRPTPLLRGPVLFQPGPLSTEVVATGLEVLVSDGTVVLVTTWRGGKVDVAVLVDPVEGMWSVGGKDHEALDVRVATVEGIDVPVRREAKLAVVTCEADGERLFLTSEGKVWQVDFRLWLRQLHNLSQEEGNAETYSPAPSQVTCIFRRYHLSNY